MAVVNVLTKGSNHRKTIYSVDDAPGSTEPIYLGSKYIGETVQIGMLITGSSYEDARVYIETTLVGLFKANDIITIGPGGDIDTLGISLTGKIESMTYGLKPVTSRQKVNMSFRLGFVGE